MRKIFILWAMLITAFAVQAQNNETYLSKAFELLLEGNVKSAENHYTVYKKLSGKTDADFEAMLQNDKANQKDAWRDECYIIDVDSQYALAVQKSSISEKMLLYNDASLYAQSSRVAGFTDWRLPSLKEMMLIVSNLPYNTFDFKREIKYFGNREEIDSYWTTTIGTNAEGKSHYVVKVGVKSIKTDDYYENWKINFLIVRKFKKE